MEDGTILDSQISASSSFDFHHKPQRVRFNTLKTDMWIGGWSKKKTDMDSWLQVDFLVQAKIWRIATQCRHYDDYCFQSFLISLSNDGAKFNFYKEFGNVRVGDI